jgi:hypothetical protein
MTREKQQVPLLNRHGNARKKEQTILLNKKMNEDKRKKNANFKIKG